MKKIVILVITLLILHHFSFAEKVNIETVRKIAVKVFIENYLGSDKDEIIIDQSIPFITDNDTLFYILNFKQNGFVIISADNAAPPVLGYCYKNKFEQSNLPPGLEYLLSRYKGEILCLRKEKVLPTKEIKNKWDRLLDNKVSGLKSAKSSVSPLCNTTWAQGYSYNMYCPVDNGSHVPAGCVAVAMAQVLYKWNCRVEGTGQHSYQSDYGTEYADFENANYQWHAMSATSSNQYNALLIYHCGVSTDMDYGPDGSSTTVHKAAVALRDYFGFPDKTKKIIRWFHPFNWKSTLIGNLNRGLPIIYGADQFLAPGHSWVIDGYNEDEKFHCNWGWSGTDNGYYELGNFCPPHGGCYNYNEVAIIEIDPVRITGVETPVLSAETFTYNPNGYTITIPEAEGATSYQWSCSHGTIQGSGTSVTLYSDCNSTVSVRAYNSQCQIYSGYDSETMTINYGPITGPDPVCISNSTFTLTNYPSGSTVNWTKSSNLRYVSGQGSGNYTVKAYSSTTSGAGWVKATVTNSGCNPIITHKSFWVGKPNPSILGSTILECNFPEWYFINSESYQWGDFNWSTDYMLRIIGTTTGHKAEIEGLEEGYGQIFCEVTNTCGSAENRLVVWIECWFFKMSPNPADDYVEISINESKLVENKIDEYEVRIYNGMNIMVSQLRTSKPTLRINTRQFINGVYYVHFIFNGKQQVEQLVISH